MEPAARACWSAGALVMDVLMEGLGVGNPTILVSGTASEVPQ